ncbi:MAG: hypothetical protein VX642_12520 [Bdellovibrionota bacterium]|nr:hypothetical protein [Bdellovibrionota bacterium]
MRILASFVITLFSIFPEFVVSQTIDPACFRLEGVQLPCITGGIGAKQVSCSGDTLSKEACEKKICQIPVPIEGSITAYTLGACKAYSYQCAGQGGGDGCEIGCALQGNSCVNVKTGPKCDKYPNITCTKARGSCIEFERICKEVKATCYEDRVGEAGKAEYNEDTRCCTCPQVRIPRCGSC